MKLKAALADLERRLIWEALLKHRWNKSRAARELGICRTNLFLKIEKYGLDTVRR